MKDFLSFVLQFQQNLLTVPAIVFFMSIAVVFQNNKGAQDRLVAGLIGALAPISYYERKNIPVAASSALKGLASVLSKDTKHTEEEEESENQKEEHKA